jgi:sugar phosphate isomerase/epimerase
MPGFAIGTLNHSPLHGFDPSMATHLDAAKDAGFDALAPDIFWLRALEKEGTSLESLAQALAERGLACSEIAGLAIGNEAETLVELDEILRYARVLKTEFVNARVVIPPSDDVRDRLRRCAETLAEVDARIALEFSNGTELKNLTQARAFVESARTFDAPAVGLTLDTWHFCQASEGPDWEGLDALPVESLANVQLSDGVAFEGRPYGEETMHHRRFAGEGDLDLERCAVSLRSKGFDGPVVVEVLSAKLRERTIPDFVSAAGETTRAWWNC